MLLGTLGTVKVDMISCGMECCFFLTLVPVMSGLDEIFRGGVGTRESGCIPRSLRNTSLRFPLLCGLGAGAVYALIPIHTSHSFLRRLC